MAMVLTHSTLFVMFDKEPKSGKNPHELYEALIASSLDDRIKGLLLDLHNEIRLIRAAVSEHQERAKPKRLWLSSKEVCLMLGISKRSLQTYRDQGIMPYQKINGKFLYDKKVVSKLLEAG